MPSNLSNLYDYYSRSGEFELPLPTPSSYFVFKHLVNSAGEFNMAIDVASHYYEYASSSGFITILNRVNTIITDATIKPDKFGGLAALSTGILVETFDPNGTKLISWTDSHAIKMNMNFTMLSGSDVTPITGAGDDSIVIRWTIAKAGAPLLLKAGESIRYTVQDCIGSLTLLMAFAQGLQLPDTIPEERV